jgi:hypothetical protein
LTAENRARVVRFVAAIVLLVIPVPGPAQEKAARQLQQRAVAAIEQLGGSVDRWEPTPGKPVTDVVFHRPVRDEHLPLAGAFPTLRSVAVCQGQVTDAGMARLAALPGLEVLTVEHSPVTDAGLVHLGRMPRLRFVRLVDTAVTDAGVARLKEALPYALVWFERPGEQPRWTPQPSGFPLLVAGGAVLLGVGASLLLRRCPWGPVRRRRWVWKFPVVVAAVLVPGAGLVRLAPVENSLNEGDPASFWLSACGLDVGLKGRWSGDEIYQPRDGWFIYYAQGFEERVLYVVPAADAVALFPKVVEKLRKAPPGVLRPGVEDAFRAWVRSGAAPDDAAGFLAELRASRLAGLQREKATSYKYVIFEEVWFDDRWARIGRYPWNLQMEFLFLAGLVLFAAWPWLRGSGRLGWAIHLGLLPVLFCLPFWLGYAAWTFTSIPSGGVLYPRLLRHFQDLPWTSLDERIARVLPPVLEPLSQTPGSPMGLVKYFRGVGPVAVMVMGLVLGVAVWSVGAIRPHTRAEATRRPGG